MKRKQRSAALKAKIVIEALRETKTITELAAEHQIHPNLITKWKQAALQEMPSLFERGTAKDEKGAGAAGLACISGRKAWPHFSHSMLRRLENSAAT